MIKNILNFNLEELSSFKTIYVLVSGGIDSTYLYELISQYFPEKTIATNCFNPFEQSDTLTLLMQTKNAIQIKNKKTLRYNEILKSCFLKIPYAIERKNEGKYDKHIFQCCKLIKHNSFLKTQIFQENGSVIISGIKPRDSKQRSLWLKSLRTGIETSKNTNPIKGFFHKHKSNILYCYPYRDYDKFELPDFILEELRLKYPNLTHSGCILCPILIVFENKSKNNKDEWTRLRYKKSLEYYNKIKESD